MSPPLNASLPASELSGNPLMLLPFTESVEWVARYLPCCWVVYRIPEGDFTGPESPVH